MVREATREDLQEILELYLFLHETAIPEQTDSLLDTASPYKHGEKSI